VAAHPLVSLTSVNQAGTLAGRRAASLLVDRIAGREEAVHEVLTPKLMVRRSSAAPAHA
jgi:LacI family transcriptional regulator